MHPIPSSSYTKAGLLCAMLIISCPLKNYCSCTFKMWHFGGGHRPQFTSSLRRKLIKSERFYSTDIITTSALDDRKLIKTTSVSKKDQLFTSGRPVRRNFYEQYANSIFVSIDEIMFPNRREPRFVFLSFVCSCCSCVLRRLLYFVSLFFFPRSFQ